MMRLTFFPGAFQVEGCEGTSPVLQIVRGVEYEFVQNAMTNWNHPIGLAYYPDGATYSSSSSTSSSSTSSSEYTL